MKTDIEISSAYKMRDIREVASDVGIATADLSPMGHYIAKVPERLIDEKKVADSNLILVTAITPTRAGVGKTTVSIGLSMGLNHIGKKAMVALREPFGTMFWDERRSGRRRVCSGSAHGRHQLAFYR
jgi:formate--tetrahydrofolate ligase